MVRYDWFWNLKGFQAQSIGDRVWGIFYDRSTHTTIHSMLTEFRAKNKRVQEGFEDI
jgi:hypothetical protein